MSIMTAEPRLYSIEQTRELLGNAGRSTVNEMIASGRLASVKLGARRLVPASAIEALIAELEAAA